MTFEQIPSSVLERRDLSPLAKIVYAFMRPCVAKGLPVGQRLIGRRCGVSKSSVVKAQKELVACEPPLLVRVPGSSGARGVFALAAEAVTPSTAPVTHSTEAVTRPTEPVTPSTGHASSPERSPVRPVTPSTGTGHPFDHHRSHPRPEAVTPSTTTIPQTNSQTIQTTARASSAGEATLGDSPGPVVLRRVWEIFLSITGLGAGRNFASQEQRCLEVYRWGVERRGDDWLAEVRRAVEAFGRADHGTMKSPWAVFASSPGQWLEAEIDRPLGRGPVPARTEADFEDAEDVQTQLDRQLGVGVAE